MNCSENHVSEDERFQRSHKLVLPLITLCILFVIVSVAATARESMRSADIQALPVIASNHVLFNESGLDVYEMKVLTKIYEAMDLSENRHQKDSQNFIYFNTLKRYLTNTKSGITLHKVTEAEVLTEDVNAVTQLEATKNLKDMSLDGRNIALNLLKELYELCGLHIDISLEGEIDRIYDQQGFELYANNTSQQESLHIEALIITVGIIIVLICICIVIAKKNRLFVKDVIYDGFDEKRFA